MDRVQAIVGKEGRGEGASFRRPAGGRRQGNRMAKTDNPKKAASAGEKETAAVSGRMLVYGYIRQQMREGNLLPGSVLNLQAISQKLGISNTPLRDSLIRLEAEGYLTIYPRSKVVINTLEADDFPFLYEIMGGLEYTIIAGSIDQYAEATIAKMRRLNADMKEAVLNGDMVTYDRLHYLFHSVFFEISPNIFAERILSPIKNRLWDFPRKNFVREWYLAAVEEHFLIIDAIEERNSERLMHCVKELHWGYKYNAKYIRKEYNLD